MGASIADVQLLFHFGFNSWLLAICNQVHNLKWLGVQSASLVMKATATNAKRQLQRSLSSRLHFLCHLSFQINADTSDPLRLSTKGLMALQGSDLSCAAVLHWCVVCLVFKVPSRLVNMTAHNDGSLELETNHFKWWNYREFRGLHWLRSPENGQTESSLGFYWLLCGVQVFVAPIRLTVFTLRTHTCRWAMPKRTLAVGPSRHRRAPRPQWANDWHRGFAGVIAASFSFSCYISCFVLATW